MFLYYLVFLLPGQYQDPVVSIYNIYYIKLHLTVCLFGCPIITLEPLGWFTLNYIGELGWITGLFLAWFKSSRLRRLTFLGKTWSRAGSWVQQSWVQQSWVQQSWVQQSWVPNLLGSQSIILCNLAYLFVCFSLILFTYNI